MKPKFFVIIVAFALWVALGASVAQAQSPFSSAVINAPLSKVISRVVDPEGLEVHIYCDFSVDPWATPGDWRNRNTWVSPVRCAQVEALVRGHRPNNAKAKREFGEALLYLLRGTNLAAGLYLDVAECRAVQQVEFLAEELGVGRVYARDLANLAWRRAYKLESCRPGGPMDFHLGRWPTVAYFPPSNLDGKG